MNAVSSKRVSGSYSGNRKSAIQNPIWVGIVTLVVTLVMGGAAASAQQPTKIPRIGYLGASSPTTNPARIEAFRRGLRELGYWRKKILSLSGDMQRENLMASPRSRLS